MNDCKRAPFFVNVVKTNLYKEYWFKLTKGFKTFS